jgi:hypothetical protein
VNPEEKSQLTHDLDIVTMTLSNQIQTMDQRDFIRASMPTLLRLLMAMPLLAVLIQCIRWWTGVSAGWFFSWTTWAILTLLFPLAWLFARVLSHQVLVSRHRALRAADDQIGSSERLVTADDFLQQPKRDGFMQAAVEDAVPWAHRAREASLDQTITKPGNRVLPLWPIPGALAALLLAGFLSQFARTRVTEDPSAATAVAMSDPISLAPKPDPPKQDPPVKEQPEASAERKPAPDQPSQRTVNRQGSAGTAIPEDAEESRGRLSEGETRESQQAANPSSARGTPSTSGQPSKSGDEAKRKRKPQQKKPEAERQTKRREQEEKPSGATAGQGSSKGSDNSAAPSDWASTSQAATPDDEDIEDEEDVADEEEEQESRGGVQPNLRDRRTPVNRDLQIGFGTNRPNPDANGRGGPGGQKKSRGVASLVLGVPIPDRVHGQPNKGRIRITQQRITPEAEQSDPVDAQDRLPRQGAAGLIHHPDFSPWLQDFVRRYFLQRRAQFPLKTSTQETTTSTSSSDSLQTSNVAESGTPQS